MGTTDSEPKSLCLAFKRMDNVLMRFVRARMAEAGFDEVTVMHGWILGFLFRNKDRAVYQKDIEEEFSIAKSTVTNILKCMEKKGYVTRVPDEHDARLKRLELTARGENIHKKAIHHIDEIHARIETDISDEERQCFWQILFKIKNNMNNIEKGMKVDD
ncbi:MAG: MarR family winged helix-turn-helix transcriptional regulator [Butyrivibrio sp.]